MYGHRQAVTAAALIMLGAAAGCATPQPPPPTRNAPSRPAPADRTPVPTSPAPRASGPAERVAAPVARPRPTAVTRADLLANRVDLPAWRAGAPCAADRARLTENPHEHDVHLQATRTGDVDGDGDVEAVAILQCTIGTGGPMQAVAFGRDRHGDIVALGQVVRATRDRPQWLIDVDVRRDGAVRIEVGDYFPGGGWPGTASLRQHRTYRWTGEQFRQTAGPTSFPANPHMPS